MAKKVSKKKGLMAKFEVEFECVIKINPDSRDAFYRDLKRKELCLSAEFVLDDIFHGMLIYSNYIENGIEFQELDSTNYKVSAKGLFQTEYDAEIYAQLQAADTTPLLLKDVCDSNVASHYIDGDEDKSIVIGKYLK